MMRNFLSLLPALFLTLLAAGIVACDDTPDHSSSEAPGSTSADTSATVKGSGPVAPPSATTGWEVREDFARYFADSGVTGSFILYDPQKNIYLAYDTARCRTRFSPASTFKIFNSLVFLETGALRDENEVIPWDSVKRSSEDWNKDHTLRSAIKYSVVWFYQKLAREVGKEQLQHYLDTIDYGNHTIGGKVDEFWLDGSLQISPVEQLAFLVRLHNNDLPFSQRTIDIVKDILIKEKTPECTYRGKTGWSLRTERNIGWFVGYVERKEGAYFFAINIDMDKEGKKAQARQDIVRNILRDMKLVDAVQK